LVNLKIIIEWAKEVIMLEDLQGSRQLELLSDADKKVVLRLSFRPFEIKTLRLHMQESVSN
jgi:hypothetical protein